MTVLLAAVAGAVGVYYLLRPGRFATVDAGKLYRCRQPLGMQWKVVKAYGIRTVINLRPRDEDAEEFDSEVAACRDNDFKLVEIPISHMPPTDDMIAKFLTAARADAPAVVHCEFGKNRTGFMAATYRVVVQDWPAQRAMDELLDLETSQTPEMIRDYQEILERLHRDRLAWLSRTAG